MRLTPLFLALAAAAGLLGGCQSGAVDDDGDGPSSGTDQDAGTDAPSLSAYCDGLGLPARPFDATTPGSHRGEVAGDFTVTLTDGSTWHLRDQFQGCDSYIFLPDTLRKSDTDATSLWNADLDQLVALSPPNVHYFFVSRATDDDAVNAATTAMDQRIADLVASLSGDDAARWAAHLHVVKDGAAQAGGIVAQALGSWGRGGFGIDRRQKLREVGLLSDVTRFDSAVQSAGGWPYDGNLSFAAYEAQRYESEEQTAERLDAEGAKVLPLWGGEVLSEFAEKDVDFPSASEIATYDTLELDVTSACPDATKSEFANNCGAWDYIASFSIAEDDGTLVEVARFITSYHRETHWVVDATPALALLAGGGKHHVKWDFAPSWNTQPTATTLSIRLSSQGKGVRPTKLVPMFTGGDFGSGYAAAHPPIDASVPAGAKRVDFWCLLTGHGSDSDQCSEFCNHWHEFTFGSRTLKKVHNQAGTQTGCIASTTKGMVPNQGGTWWYGRGGWCPGEQVDPWVTDVTADVTIGGTTNVTYTAFVNGTAIPAKAGNIDLTSYLVVYE